MTTLEENIKVAVTIFYSNYSGNCKALLQRINNSNLMDKLSLKFINVDNNIMKSIITRKFSVVPTIVVMIEDEISLYTGDNVFEWFNIFVSSHQSSEPITSKNIDEGARKEPVITPNNSLSVGNRIPSGYDSSLPLSGNLPDKELKANSIPQSTEPISIPSKGKSILDIAAEISKAREKL
jgi:hypothetical protein